MWQGLLLRLKSSGCLESWMCQCDHLHWLLQEPCMLLLLLLLLLTSLPVLLRAGAGGGV
jgi:hypothetical protein